MADLGVHFLNTPFGYEPYEPEVTISLSGCLFANSEEVPNSILVEVLDMQGNPAPGSVPLDLNAGVILNSLNPVVIEGAPMMYYAFPKAPKDPGTYQIRASIVFPSGPIAPRMRTIRVIAGTPGQVTPRAADLPSPTFQIEFTQPKANAQLSSVQPINVACLTRIVRSTAYGYFLLIDETTGLIAATGFNSPWLLGPDGGIMPCRLKAPLKADGPHSIVLYILQMNQATILESKSHPVRMVGYNVAKAAPARATAESVARNAPAFRHAVPDSRLDPNRASARELMRVPGIGRAFAKRIVEARPFESVEDVVKLKNFPKAKIEDVNTYFNIFES